MSIHPTAVVDRTAELGAVTIGPGVVVGPRVVLHDGVDIGPGAILVQDTLVGPRSRIHAHAVIGDRPQVRGDDGEGTTVEIGSDVVIREFVTIHRGSRQGLGVTRVGDRVWLMVGTHVAHDCVIGQGSTLANQATLGGHVVLGANVMVGGLTGIHQRTQIGRLAMIAAGSMVTQHIPPFLMASGDRARLLGIHRVGLQRHGVSPIAITALGFAYQRLFSGPRRWSEAIVDGRLQAAGEGLVEELLEFLEHYPRVCGWGKL